MASPSPGSRAAAHPHTLNAPSLSLGPGVEGLSLDMASLVDIRDYVNKELALRIQTDIDSQATFFTDHNGFQVICRALETPWSRTWTVFFTSVSGTGGLGGGWSAHREIRDSFRPGPLGAPTVRRCP